MTLRRLVHAAVPLALPALFALTSGRHVLAVLLSPGAPGFDAQLYAQAARAWLSGMDPWQMEWASGRFVGPPPLLVPFVPFAFAPVELVAGFWIVADLAIVILVLRRLRLPAWWIGFPPIVETVTMGNPEALVVGLLVLGGTRSGLAAALKPYAALPLLGERRWRAIGLAIATLAASLVVLPWGMYFWDAPVIAQTIVSQTGVTSAFGSPVLMVIGAAGLAALGLRRNLWLAVPVLWPYGHLHYATMTVPMLPAATAAFWAIPDARFTVAGVIAPTVLEVWRRRPGRRPVDHLEAEPLVLAPAVEAQL
jgi:hypothetical protein